MTPNARRWLWLGLLTVSSVGFSLALTCAAPLAALATVAALHMARRDAVALALSAWAANQLVGFVLLHYPHTADSYAWGAAIGLGGLLATAAALATAPRLRRFGSLATIAGAFVAASMAYQAAMAVGAAVLPHGGSAISWPVVSVVVQVNALALAGLLALHWLATAVGLMAREPAPSLR